VTPEEHLTDLASAYTLGEPIVVTRLPEGATSVRVVTAAGDVVEAEVGGGAARCEGLPLGTHSLEAGATDGTILAEEFFSVRARRGDDPVMAFATSFGAAARSEVMTWLRRLRCTVVQFYDWMDSYSYPLAEADHYADPLGRPLERGSVATLIGAVEGLGIVAQAYAPVCAADADLADEHADWRLFRNDGRPQSLGDLLQIMNPGNTGWRRHWLHQYGRAMDALGFTGLHLDTYGHPRNALDQGREPVDMASAYGDFVFDVRAARPDAVVSFNLVNGVPQGFAEVPAPSFRYVEVWPPNDQWRHLEGLLQRSSGTAETEGSVLAIYPPVWGEARSRALRTAVLTEAVATALGANVMLWGDAFGVLRHPYYVNHETLTPAEADEALEWHRFALRCRDLFRAGIDTSWTEMADENAAVTVEAGCKVAPEPGGGTMFVRVRRGDGLIAVSLLDLTGSAGGSWTEGAGPGRCEYARVSVLVDEPQRWRADVALVDREGGRFHPVRLAEVAQREGRGVSCTVPVSGGWAVLRLKARKSPV
jgi:dextranase